MHSAVAVTGSQLLKNVHVSHLQIIMLIDMIIKAQEKTVLIKIIIDNLFTEIDV